MKKTLLTLFCAFSLQLFHSQVSFAGNQDYGRMKNFAYDKTTPNKIYATSYIGKHILVSEDNGVTWNVLFTLPYPEYSPNILELRLTNNGTAISFIEYFGLGSSMNKVAILDLATNSIIKEYQFPQNEDIQKIDNYSIFDNGSMNTISMLASGIENKFFTSTNGGESWTKVYDTADHESVILNDAIMDPKNPQILYIVRNGGAGNEDGGFFKSTDGGATWTETLNGLILQSVAVDPNNTDIIYAGSGITWSYPEQHQALYKSTNGGITWTEETQIPWSTEQFGMKMITKIEINPNNSNHVVVMGDDRVAVTTNGGATWTTTVSNGLSDGDSYFYGINATFNPSKPNEVLISNNHYPKFSSDNGVTLTSIKSPFFIGMGNTNIINDNGADKLMYGVQYGYALRNLETNEETPVNVMPLNESPLGGEIDLVYADKDYAGRTYIYKSSFMGNNIKVSNDYGATSTTIHTTYDTYFTAAETDSSNPNIAWLATFNGETSSLVKVNFSNPDEIQTDFITLPYDGDYIFGIKVSKNNPNEVLVTVGNRVLKTTDGGTNWTQITAGLEDLALPNIGLSLVQNPLNLNQYTMAGSNGIYTSMDNGTTWSKIYNGFIQNVEHSPKANGQIVGINYTNLDILPKVVYTSNGGTTWAEKTSQNYFDTPVISGAIRFMDNENAEVYLTSQSLGILKDNISLEFLATSDINNFKDDISVYPNPTQNFINIKLDKSISKFKASLYNAAGQVLLTTENRSSINISNLNKGVYFLTIVPENGKSITKKIIKN